MLSCFRVFYLFFFFCSALSAQTTHDATAKDTIFYRNSFLNRTYLLDGKPVNLPVMAFFMKGYPAADNEIQLAQFSDQLTVASYSLGSLLSIGGLVLSRQNKALGEDLVQLGLAGIGTGLIFQIITGGFKFRAVQHYNNAIKKRYPKTFSTFRFKADLNRVGILIEFD